MNSIKYLFYLFNFLVFLVWLFFTFNFTGYHFNIGLLKELSPVISAFAASVNLVFVFAIFRLNKKQKEKDDNLTRISYWYRNLIIDKNIDFISEKFETIKSLTEKLCAKDCSQDKLAEIFESFKVEKRLLIQNIDDMVRILDINFADYLDCFLDDFEDSYTEKVEDLFTCINIEWGLKENILNNDISEHKQRYLYKLYEYEKNGYTYNV